MNHALRSEPESPSSSDGRIAGERIREKRRLTAVSARIEPIARLLVEQDDRLIVVRVEEIDWVESAGNYVRLHVGKAEFSLRHTLSGLALQLDPQRFVQVHRRAIVNLDSIAEVMPVPTGELSLRLRDGSSLAVSRRHRRQLLARLRVS